MLVASSRAPSSSKASTLSARIEDGARLRHRQQGRTAFFRQDDAVKLGQALFRVGACLGDRFALARQVLRFRHQQQIARGTGNHVEILDDVIGQHGLGVFVFDDIAHARIEAGQAQHAQRSSCQQQGGQKSKRPTQARSNIHIC